MSGIRCPIHACSEYRKLEATVKMYDEQYQFLKSRGETFDRVLEALNVANDLKNQHLYKCDGQKVKMTAAMAKKWAKVYAGH